MLTTGRTLHEARLDAQVVEAGLDRRARESANTADIEVALARGETLVLIELQDNLSDDFDSSCLIDIDHHGPHAGARKPSSLRQIHDLISYSTQT